MTEVKHTEGQKLKALLERVEKASGPDRALDEDLIWHLVAMPTGSAREVDGVRQTNVAASTGGQDWRSLGPYFYGTQPGPTASIDAALALVERCLPGTALYILGRAIARLNLSIGIATAIPRLPRLIVCELLTALISQEQSRDR